MKKSDDRIEVLIIHPSSKECRFFGEAFLETNFKATIVTDGEAGYTIASRHDWIAVIVVSDTTLGRMKPDGLVQQLRIDGNRVPVILMSRNPRAVSPKLRAIFADVVPWPNMKRPVNVNELVAAMNAVLKRRI